ncbi:restriction endonuclease subunit S [Acinetobacter baumannii]|uniref:restriction endonuclease subunit S n=1 Tax=Acinetobacter baumannii TaxID=470 RepID=UPI003AF8FE94
MSNLSIPKEWLLVQLGDYIDVIRGASPRPKGDPRYFGGDINWISIKDVNAEKGKYLTTTREFVTQAGADKSRLLPVGSLILSNSASVCIPKILKKEGCIHDGFVTFPKLGEQFSIDYFFHLFNWMRPSVIEKNRQGVTQVNLNTDIIRSFELPIPALAEQQIIAEKLDTLLAQVESIKARLERISEILKQFRQSVLAAAMSGKLTEEWRRNNHTSAQQELNDLVNREYLYLQHKVKDQKSKTLKEKVELRGAGTKQSYEHDFPASWVFKPFFEFCLLNRGFDLPSSARTEGQYPILSAGGVSGTHVEYMVEGPCITVGRSGSVGQVFFSEGRCWPLNTVLYVKDYGFSDPKYVYYKLIHMNLAQYASSTAVPTLNRNEFIQKLVAIPSSAEQKEIVHIVEHLFEVSTSIEKQAQSALDRINNLTQSILAKAFRGELTAEWREAHSELISGENSAEALLERIKAERSIKPVTKRGRGKA